MKHNHTTEKSLLAKKHPNHDIGKSIKRHRTSLGMSLRDYADKAGVSNYTGVLRLERGHDVRLSLFRKLARRWMFDYNL